MTEHEWLTVADPDPLLAYLIGNASPRKLRLFACGRCRELWADLPDPRARAAVEVAERYADRQATEDELEAACDLAQAAFTDLPYSLRVGTAWSVAGLAAVFAAGPYSGHLDSYRHPRFGHLEQPREANLLRDAFGNPFRPVTVEPAWLTSDVLVLAAGIYAERAFDRLPILADALQDAGCDNGELLGHCRGPGPHVRGCGAVDLVLGQA